MEHAGIADRAAARFVRSFGRIDAAGRDVDDYRQLLRIKAWQAEKRCGEAPFVFTAVRNQVRSFARALGRAPEMARFDMDPDLQLDNSFERQVEIRDVVRRVAERLAGDDFGLLVMYTEHGCDATSAWDSLGRPEPISTFRARIRKIRKDALRVLKTLEIVAPEGSPAL